MLFKLAFRNVKRSIGDFLIYFLTLTFAVCIFYSFNSIGAQQAMLDVTEAKSNTVDTLVLLLSYVSVFVSVVLGFLIIYANNFLIKRRKKELGLYMSLGMSKYKISRILVTETIFVGLLSLVAGLGLGILASQGLSFLTAKMFEVDVKKYEFIISTEAIGKTALYFGIIYLLVILFNTFTITRYKLIDLLTASRKNETLKVRKTWVSILLFMISVICLFFSYRIILENGLFAMDNTLAISIGLGVVGTFLFFMSLSGFLLNMLKRNKKIYYNGINMFVLRQINSKVNTTFLSMSVISLMLFFTIGVLSTGFSIKNSMESGLETSNPFDASFYSFTKDESKSAYDVNSVLKDYKIDPTKYDQSYSFNEYNTNIDSKALLKKYQDSTAEKLIKGTKSSIPLTALKQSDYKKIAEMQGEEAFDIPKDSVFIFYNMENFRQTNENLIDKQKTLTIQGKEYKIINERAEKFSYSNTFNASDAIVVVLPDDAVKGMTVYESIWNANYKPNAAYDKEIMDKLDSQSYGPEVEKRGYAIYALTKTSAYDAAVGNSTIFVFLGIYLGAIFLIASTAVLALQQLSEASDNISRYSMLKKIGVPTKVSNRAVFKQIGIYFLMPLSLAIVHSFFGIKVVNEAVMIFGESSVLVPSLITGAILVLVYGGYMLATYIGYKKIVN